MSPLALQAVLLSWIPFSLLLFRLVRLSVAVPIVILGATMFLPNLVEFDLPLVPPIDKEGVAALSLLIAMLAFYPGRIRAALGSLTVIGIVATIFLSNLGTVLTNHDAQVFGPTTLPGLRIYDALSMCLRDSFGFVLPFVLARATVRSKRELRDLLWVLGCAGLVYSLFILVEIKMSPQFHRWVYGYHQHAFHMTIRLGGYRPQVFMSTGLGLVMFMLSASGSWILLARTGEKLFGVPGKLISAYLVAILVACKSMASIVYGLFAFPVLFFLKPRVQLRIAAILAVFIMLYPALRIVNAFPADGIVAVAASVNADRARSLSYRFNSEEQLIERGRERLSFGWGGFGRNRIWSEKGRSKTVTDGMWIIVFGMRGAFGHAAFFGLLLSPVWIAWWRQRWIPDKRYLLQVSGLALILTILCLDLLPNGWFTYLPGFLSGALSGAVPDRAPSRRSRASRPRGEGPGSPRRARGAPAPTVPDGSDETASPGRPASASLASALLDPGEGANGDVPASGSRADESPQRKIE